MSGIDINEYVKDNKFDPRREIAKEKYVTEFFK